MVTPELLSYIKTQLDAKASRERIVEALVAQGWLPQDIEAAMKRFPEASRFTTTGVPTARSASAPGKSPISQYTTGELLGIEQLFRDTVALYRKRFVPLLLIQATAVAATLFPIITTFGLSLTSQSETPFPLNSLAQRLFLGVLFFLIPMVVTVITTLTQFHLIAGHEQRIGVQEALSRAMGQLGSYVWLSLLFSLILFGGTVLLVIPAFVFALWFAFSFFALVVDGSRGTGALMRSKYYVEGRTLEVFVRLLVLLLGVGVVSVALIMVQFVVQILLSLVSPMMSIVAQLLMQLPLALITIFVNVFIYTLYMDLRRTKPSPDASRAGPVWPFVLIAILGIVIPIVVLILIGAVSLVSINPTAQFEKVRSVQIKADLTQTRNALLQWNIEKGPYPTLLVELVPTYLPRAPVNPNTDMPFFYERLQNGADFRLCDTPEGTCLTSSEADVFGLPRPTTAPVE